jgi:rhodanese-related sulfurtransferase
MLKSPVSPFSRRRRPLLQSWGLLLATALFCGVIFQILRPNPLPWTADREQRLAAIARSAGLFPVDAPEARELIRRGEVVVFDARSRKESSSVGIPGAFSLPNAQREQIYPDFAAVLTPHQPLLTYCGGADCSDALELGRFLLAQGHESVYLLLGGLEAWQNTKEPTAP